MPTYLKVITIKADDPGVLDKRIMVEADADFAMIIAENKKLKEAIDLAPCEYKHACLEGTEEWEIKARELQTENSDLKERMTRTMQQFCTCGGTGVNRLKMCLACHFKHSFE